MIPPDLRTSHRILTPLWQPVLSIYSFKEQDEAVRSNLRHKKPAAQRSRKKDEI